MQSKKTAQRNLRILVCAALLAAISIVCGKFLAFGVGNVLRFSFENLPIILAGVLFGPLVGGLTGAIADLLGCMMVGYAINPLVTAGAVSIGLLAGACSFLLHRCKLSIRLTVSVAAAHLIGSVLIKTLGLAVWYDLPLYQLMLWRLLNYFLIGMVEWLILFAVLRSRAVMTQLGSLTKERENQ